MKQSECLKILNLARKSLEEYKNWGENEVYKASSANVSCGKAVFPKTGRQAFYAEISSSGEELGELREKVSFCKKCPLGEKRLNAVFGCGSPDADLVFVGEGPGYDEDHIGKPFVGRAGQLLTKIIEAMGQARESVYIANIVKCHAMIDPSNPEKRSNDRPPTLEEMEICRPYLDMQLEIIKPKIIVTLGASSTKGLLNSIESISRIRGSVREYKGIKLIPTFHPAALLRNQDLKKFVWEDMKKVMHYLDTGEI
ncbi:uracil-DNA glycosylase [Endomicrobiia bacterium]|uniref:Type-4 uracil-DNA glycosylase n=1 Tax=Endomicrobium trichonymphae TaxID=1408204 RepID=B1H0K1_ENDTX|nr:uracil-DNA glycosylase [Candidatus Endomicrobium trichonymphae]GHT06769.1 uracil-DNA glycosylase [Endomicrobiia bacterium]BAG14033.1 uracil-DNA glycosylase [Candidatus Endomicrobium trichonymphae]GHT10054.1 uracil-DNA glycosylase [Endomicrobiia bacterium]GHT14190.1 uracil-DNA glycosylase [Endomicrobiia bacterium]GHT16157.1 uracil-DNA glycosylase [Endomicrobiia bacterium]